MESLLLALNNLDKNMIQHEKSKFGRNMYFKQYNDTAWRRETYSERLPDTVN